MNNENNERMEQIQAEINACKILLRDTDYSLYKLLENVADCDTFADLKTVCAAYLEQYGDTVEKRRAWRARINELEEALAELEAATPEEAEEETEGEDE